MDFTWIEPETGARFAADYSISEYSISGACPSWRWETGGKRRERCSEDGGVLHIAKFSRTAAMEFGTITDIIRWVQSRRRKVLI